MGNQKEIKYKPAFTELSQEQRKSEQKRWMETRVFRQCGCVFCCMWISKTPQIPMIKKRKNMSFSDAENNSDAIHIREVPDSAATNLIHSKPLWLPLGLGDGQNQHGFSKLRNSRRETYVMVSAEQKQQMLKLGHPSQERASHSLKKSDTGTGIACQTERSLDPTAPLYF